MPNLKIRGNKTTKTIAVACATLGVILVVGSYFKYQNNKIYKFIPKKYEDTVFEYHRLPDIPKARGLYHLENENSKEATNLYNKVRVLCLIITNAGNLERKATAVKDTWSKRCNKHLFFTTDEHKEFGTIALHVEDGRDHLTAKTNAAFRYAYNHYHKDFDWFFKSDDDTYVIVENLRYLLSNYDSNKPVYIGHHFDNVEIANHAGYMSGGGGYALSRTALDKLVRIGINESHPRNLCRKDGGAEDAAIGRCMNKLGIKPAKSLDKHNRETFHPFNVFTHLAGNYPSWYNEYKQQPKQGPDSLSDYSITFHYVDPIMMYTMDHLIYHIHTYGVIKGRPEQPVFHVPQEQISKEPK